MKAFPDIDAKSKHACADELNNVNKRVASTRLNAETDTEMDANSNREPTHMLGLDESQQ
jgi:hypothetical protein